MFEALETFTPKVAKLKTLPDFFRKKVQDQTLLIDKVVDDKNSAADKKRPLESLGGFITAKQYEECKKLKLDTSQTTTTTINSFLKNESEVITNVVDDNKQENVKGTIITSELINKMEDKSKVEKLKILFGDESDGEKECNKKRDEDDKRDHKHSKRKHHDRKRKIDNKSTTDDVCSDKKQCTNETNGASSSLDVTKREENKRRAKLKKSEIGTLVVKLLTPAYAERRFDSRDTFKSMARSISHALLDKGGFWWFFFFLFHSFCF